MKTGVLVCLMVTVVIGGSPLAWAETEVAVTGQLRLRPEMAANADFNDAIDDKSAFIGSRTRLYLDVKASDDIAAKVTLQDSRRWGDESNIATGTEQQGVDIFEAWFQMSAVFDAPLAVKAGRQTLVYGDQRLLGALDWKDEGRTHDALKVMVGPDAYRLDLFAAKESESGAPSDRSHDDDLLGAYVMVIPLEGLSIDLYALNWKTAGSKEVDGVATPVAGKNIMTYGARLALKRGGVDATAEFATQSGDWAEGIGQSAHAYAVTAGYTLPFWKTRLGAEYAYGSGDGDPNDTTQENFVFPFHTNHMHYGAMDFFSWGNMSDIHVGVATNPTDALTLKLDYHILALAEGKGDWLNVVGTNVFKKGVAGKSSTDAGVEIDLTAIYKARKNLKLVAGYSTFLPGEAAKERSGGQSDAATWGFLMSLFSF